LNSDKIFEVIEQIAAAKGKNEKVAIIEQHKDYLDFRQVIRAALDPLVTYGIAKRPTVGGSGTKVCGEESRRILKGLASRELTGFEAINTVAAEMASLTPSSAELLWRIISKDLRAGFGASTVNKVIKGFIPTFPYMRCSLLKEVDVNKFDWAAGCLSQEKADGMFANLTVLDTGEVQVTSREGQLFPLGYMWRLADSSKALKRNTQTHGELVVVDETAVPYPRAISNGKMNKLLSGGELPVGDVVTFLAWDQVPLGCVVPKGKCATPYIDRLEGLMAQLEQEQGAISVIQTRKVHSLDEAYEHYRALLALGKEGTVFKHPLAPWEDKTSKWQVKLKVEFDVDLKIAGVVLGKQGTKNEGRAGSLTCVSSCGQLRVDVTVKNEEMRDKIDANPHDWLERIMPVRANAVMEPSESNDMHSLFLPRFVEPEWRRDKSEPDSLERVKAQFEAVVSPA
jgi:DNA ligase-1